MPILARHEFEKEREKYEANVKRTMDEFHEKMKEIEENIKTLISEQKENAENISRDILLKFPKYIEKTKHISDILNQELETIGNDKQRQIDLIKDKNDLQYLISNTQDNLETYVGLNNDIQKLSDQERKYSQALKQVEGYNKDIEHLEDKRKFLDDLVKNKSKTLRKDKGKKAENTDVYTFMYQDTRITVRQNDLVDEYVDAIVNPANEDLNHAGGAARAIAAKAGPEFERECEDYISENFKLKTGSSMVTSAGGELKCEHVIHTVGPIYEKNKKNHSKEHEQLKRCFESILKIMIDRDFYDVSIPAISTGIFGFPLKKCVEICANTIKNMIDDDSKAFKGKEIILCNFDKKTTDVFEKHLEHYMADGSDDEEKKDYDEDEDEEFRERSNKMNEDYSSEDDEPLRDHRDGFTGDNVDSDY